MAKKSIVFLLVKVLWDKGNMEIQTAAWYEKTHFTFSDILCAVRKHIGLKTNFPTSTKTTYVGKLKQRIRYLEHTLLLAVA
ncbi:MAG: hypothetical protein D6772_12035 [Bacteroidetes bacterium]|nr:MAG: hypothetical protein D6772_12035 [Bacteroidota bacterium]